MATTAPAIGEVQLGASPRTRTGADGHRYCVTCLERLTDGTPIA